MDTASISFSPSVPISISPEEFSLVIDGPNAPLVLDVRRTARFVESDRILRTAQHCPPEHIARFAAAHSPKDVIVYCVYGHEVGQGAAEELRRAGWNARFLAGGIEGGQDGFDSRADIAAWRSQSLPLVHKQPGTDTAGGGAA